MSDRGSKSAGAAGFSVLAFCIWIAGVVLAKGFWSTLFAVIAPPWAWYLVVERALLALGWIT